jgi:hypothetical protein
MPGPVPKPDSQRSRHHQPTFQWRRLPASGRKGPAPKLPSGRKWSAALRQEWEYWWSTPQATAWDQSGRSLHRWAILMDVILDTDDAPVSMHAQVLAIEDRHGFSPAYMLKLRWLIVDDSAPAKKPPAKKTTKPKTPRAQTARLAGRLRIVS